MAAIINSLPNPVLFSAITPPHSFCAEIINLERYILQSKAYALSQLRQEQNLPVSIHAEIKSKASGNSRLLDRFYYSIQYPDNQQPGGWYAWSIHFAEGDRNPRIYEFPDDPKLPHLASFLAAPENGDVTVLRYVPLRRVTFIKPENGQYPALIGKLKKPKRCLDGYNRLNDISSMTLSEGYEAPKPAGIDHHYSVFYQTLVQGQEVTHSFNASNYLELMAEIGKLHASLRQWAIPEHKLWDREGVSLSLSNDIDEIKFYLPESAGYMEKIADWLKQHISEKAPNKTFCHGDFACPQILQHANTWSVVDFDLAGIGDPYQDMAMFMVSLNYDVPFFKNNQELMQSAYQFYLRAYQEVSEYLIDAELINCYLVKAEIYYLALSLKKNTFTSQTYEQASKRLDSLTYDQ